MSNARRLAYSALTRARRIHNREGVRELQPQGAVRRQRYEASCALAYACLQVGFEDRGGHLPPPGSAARDLLLRLVTYAPDARLLPADALRHAWFAEEPLPSANALLGPNGERPSYPRRVPETAARVKRKAEEAAPPRAEPHAKRESVTQQRPHPSSYQWD